MLPPRRPPIEDSEGLGVLACCCPVMDIDLPKWTPLQLRTSFLRGFDWHLPCLSDKCDFPGKPLRSRKIRSPAYWVGDNVSQSSIATPPGGRDEYSTRLWIAGLSDDDVIRLHSNSYGPIYANMLLMFSQTRPLGAIKKLAIQCTRWAIWEREAVERHILSLAEAASLNTPAICLKGWDPILLHSLLQRKKGLILCSIRMGPYRFLPLEAAL